MGNSSDAGSIMAVNPYKSRTAGKLSSPGGHTEINLLLELEAQCELHHARVRQQTGVIAEVTRIRDRQVQALHVEARQVQCVEHVPPELQALAFLPAPPL